MLCLGGRQLPEVARENHAHAAERRVLRRVFSEGEGEGEKEEGKRRRRRRRRGKAKRHGETTIYTNSRSTASAAATGNY